MFSYEAYDKIIKRGVVNMEITYSNFSIPLVFQLITKKKENKLSYEEVREVFSYPDYQNEFKRYGSRLKLCEFIEYFLNFENLNEHDIKNQDLREHHIYWLDLYRNLQVYEKAYDNILKKLILQMNYEKVYESFPKSFRYPKCNVVFTCGVGASYGYPFENNVFFDFLYLIKNKEYFSFPITLNHELHHIVFASNIHKKTDDLESYFLQSFASEGLAIKFINNARGIISKTLDSTSKINNDLDASSMKYLNDHFFETLDMFLKTINDIRNHKINSIDEIDKQKQSYWLNRYVEGQSEEDIPKLRQPRLYSFGNEFWGTLYDVYGLETVYEMVADPKDSFDKFMIILKKGNIKTSVF